MIHATAINIGLLSERRFGSLRFFCVLFKHRFVSIMTSRLTLIITGIWMLALISLQAQTPTITTLAATGVTDSQAVFKGTINPNGGTFEVRAEYGLTTIYGNLTLSGTYFGTGVQSCGFSPFGLATNTTYHFRITATDGTNTYVGNDMTLTTLANLPSVGAVGAGSSISNPSHVWFYAQNVAAGSSQATLSYEYGLTTAYGATVSDPSLRDKDSFVGFTSNIDVFGFLPATTYHVRAKIVNQQGTAYSPDYTFTTPSGPVLTTSSATGITDLAAVLHGTVNTDGLELHLSFEYGTTTAYGQWVDVPGYITNTSPASVIGGPYDLLPSTLYHCRLKGVWSLDNSYVYYGGDMTFTTGPPNTPPTVGTIGSYNETSYSAVVNCSPVSSGSSPATVVFEYGLTTAYGNSVTVDPVMATSLSQQAPAVAITGLAPLTTYHARCTVTNAQGSVPSADGTFTTIGIPVVTTDAATNVGDLSAKLGGTVTPNGPSTTATVVFELGTTTAYGRTVIATPNNILSSSQTPFSATATGLLPSTTYHYRAIATYSLTGNTFYGPDVTFTTGPAATPPTVAAVFTNQVNPTTAAVETFTVTSGSSPATVVWEYGTTTAYNLTQTSSPATIPINTTSTASAILGGLTPGTLYHYRCKATNNEGTGYSADATFTTLPGPSLTTNAATIITDLTAVLNGTVNANGSAYVIDFEIGTTTDYGRVVGLVPNYINSSVTTPFTSTASGLLPNATYHYRIRAMDLNYAYYYGADQSFTTGPANTPPTVTTGTPTNLAPTAVTLWGSNLSSGSSDATLVFEYGPTNTYGSQATYLSLIAASTFSSCSYQLQGLTANTTYHYRAKVTNNEGTSYGNDVTFTTSALPTVTTDAASSIAATSATLNGTYNKQGGIYTWSFDYGLTTSYGLTATSGGLIFTGGGGGILIGGGGGIIIGTGGGPDFTSHTNSATASNLSPQTTYHYRLKLTDNYGNSYYGNDATFTTYSPVEAWRALKFGNSSNAGDGADNANPSGDGIPNLLKYALGMDPAVTGTQPQAVVTDSNGSKHLCMTFFRYVANTDIVCEVQTADSPAGPWFTVATSAGGAYSGPGLVSEIPFVYNFVFNGLGFSQVLVANQVIVCDPLSTDEASHRFMRLKVTR